nr:MAG TPA: hypothetical protein [Podoviridae sp. ctgHy19]
MNLSKVVTVVVNSVGPAGSNTKLIISQNLSLRNSVSLLLRADITLVSLLLVMANLPYIHNSTHASS